MHNDMRSILPHKTRPPLLMTVKEVSRGLNLPVSKVYLMIREGLIDGIKIGCDWRIRTASVTKYLPQDRLAA